MTTVHEQKLRHLDTLIEVTGIITSAMDPLEIRTQTMAAITRLLDVEAGSLLLQDQTSGDLFFEVALGDRAAHLEDVRLAPGIGIAGWVAQHGRPVISNDAQTDPRFFPGADVISGFETRSMVCVPVRVKNVCLGVLQAINKKTGVFNRNDAVILHALANQVAIAIENTRLHRDSITDGLTGLFVRRHFVTRLSEEFARSGRHVQPLSLILLDIDHFKRVNDRWGHQTGDRVLRGVARELLKATRLSDLVARYGGEEFAVILPATPEENAHMVAERLRGAIAARPVAGVSVTASLGLASYRGDRALADEGELIRRADQALYQAKARGRNQVVVCEEDGNDQGRNNLGGIAV